MDRPPTLKAHVYHRLYASPPPRSDLAPSQLTDDGLPLLPLLLPPPPPPPTSPPPKPPPPPPTKPRKLKPKKKPCPQPPLTTTSLPPPRPPPPPPVPPTLRRRLRLVCVSPPLPQNLPHGDILLVTGSLTTHGTRPQLLEALETIRRETHEIKILTAGPRDGPCLDAEYTHTSYTHPPEDIPRNVGEVEGEGVVWLRDETRELVLRDGRRVRVFGTPRTRGGEGVGVGWKAGWGLRDWGGDVGIQDGAEIVLSAAPLRLHLDFTPGVLGWWRGDEGLRRRVSEVSPVVVVAGGDLGDGGVEVVRWGRGERWRWGEEWVRSVEGGVVDAGRLERGRETVVVNPAGGAKVVNMPVEGGGGGVGADGAER